MSAVRGLPVLLLALAASAAAAQGPCATAEIVVYGTASRAGVEVALHRITSGAAGRDSVEAEPRYRGVTDERGVYRAPTPDVGEYVVRATEGGGTRAEARFFCPSAAQNRIHLLLREPDDLDGLRGL